MLKGIFAITIFPLPLMKSRKMPIIIVITIYFSLFIVDNLVGVDRNYNEYLNSLCDRRVRINYPIKACISNLGDPGWVRKMNFRKNSVFNSAVSGTTKLATDRKSVV